ncbi:M50 family metallopeptidase [Phaeobacter gallaeciensis]|uniref:M50 family metallopeptidase n=1 Tax=Phaeobacter gallaeciensis TaxID=60890 RepID=UPI000BBBDBFE|nr:M50 family metallopeptidase [Phaeobacter gallaeciensis]ATF19297.1 Peptidase M50B-like protein [Phaeobacter gallaeciensis]ATF23406.1 Peptidase M50B-like protein [Phaeobacter gallaeciensis]
MPFLRRFITGHWQLISLTLLIVLLWSTPAVLPLRILTVFLHETSHAIVTLATGGEVLNLTIDPYEGGSVTARGGNRFLMLSAGYTGSLLIGAALFVIALRTDWDRKVLALFGALMLLVAAIYIRDLFALGFTLVTGALMLATARYLSLAVNDLILRIIGISSMIYAPLDIWDDTIARSYLRSDARMMAEEIGGTTVIWGALWLMISLAMIGVTLRYGLGRSSNIALRRSL